MTPITDEILAAAAELLDQLGKLYKNSRIYGPQHTRTQQVREEYREHCKLVAELLPDRVVLQIAYHDKRLFLENVPLPVKQLSQSPLHEILGKSEHGGFTLDLEQVDDKDLAAQIAGLDAEGGGGLNWLDREEVHHRAHGGSMGRSPVAIFSGLEDLRVDVEFCDGMVKQLAEAMDSYSDGKSGNITPLLRAGDELVDRFLSSAQQMLPITTIPYFDHFTYHHSLNVALLSLSAAKQVISDPSRLRRICQAALLHDLGKSRVPQEILYKPDRLDKEEMELVQRHPTDGAELLARFPGMDPLSVTVAFGHHIKDDGHGYPKVSSGYQMGAVTRLVEVVDIFEALTAHRPYKESLTAASAFEVIYSLPNMKSFRPFMDLLLRSVGYHPVGSRVRTSEDEVGIVVGHNNADPSQPIVRTLVPGTQQMGEQRVVLLDPRPGANTSQMTQVLTELSPQEDDALLATA